MPVTERLTVVARYFFCYQDTITVSSQGNVSLRQGADIQCYNYTLSTPFTCAPGVAIGTYCFTQL